ncbi:MAG: 16S rRNA (adenine(1518)-N(6)/adenine(1519)-N(6))-dimethyltransferase RsmA [Thermoplasmata archaeon]
MESRVRAKKALSQHFLRDRRVLERMVNYAGLTRRDRVVEIGAGTGVLTRALCETGASVIAIEKDTRLVKTYLQPLEKKYGNLRVIEGDALEIELPEFTKIVSNLPYRISSEITFRILQKKFRLGILMYQREFAERMCAGPGETGYGRLSVNVYWHAECKILEIVPRGAFYPSPKVESALVQLIPREKPPFEIASTETFSEIVNLAFQHRRKKMGTILGNYLEDCDPAIPEFLREKNYYDRRPEELSPENFGEIADWIFKRKRGKTSPKD